MGNRAVLCTEETWKEQKGTGVYLHWNGGRDSVEPMLAYCKLRGFRSPETDCYGWARFCQIAGNYLGGDGLSLGVDDINLLDCDNYDNGVYIIKDWTIVGREYARGEEQNSYDFRDFIRYLDSCQPAQQQLGEKMVDDLLDNGMSISDIAWNYHYEIESMERSHVEVKPFEVGKTYQVGNKYHPLGEAKVVARDENTLTIFFGGLETTHPIYHWRNGAECIRHTVNDKELTLMSCGEE